MRTLLFFLFLSASSILSACTCAFAPSFSDYSAEVFSQSDTSGVVQHVKFLGFRNPELGANLYDFAVVEHLYGGTTADTITLWGQDGGNCNGPIRQMIDGDEYILLHYARQGIFSYYDHTLENFSNPYPIYDFLGCGPAALEVDGENIIGPVAPGISTYTLTEFKANIDEIVIGELVSTTNGALPMVELSAWPNPTDGQLTLSFRQPIIADRLDLLDITGRVVYTQNTVPDQRRDTFFIDATGLPAGVYVARVLLSNGRIGTERIVVK